MTGGKERNFKHITFADGFKEESINITMKKILEFVDEMIDAHYVGYTFSVLALSFLTMQSVTAGYTRGSSSTTVEIRGHNKENQNRFVKAVEKLGVEVEFEVPFADRIPAMLPTKLKVDYVVPRNVVENFRKLTPIVVLVKDRKFIRGSYAGKTKNFKGFIGDLIHFIPENFDVFDVNVEGRIDAVISSSYGPIPIEFKPYWVVKAEDVRQARYYALLLDAPFAILTYFSKHSNDVQRIVVDWKEGYRSVSLEELKRLLGHSF